MTVKVVSKELVGAINQVLNYKDTLMKSFYQLRFESKDEFEVFDPKTIVIMGNYSDLKEDEKKTFEIYRRSLKDVEIVTYDEVLQKIKQLVDVLRV